MMVREIGDDLLVLDVEADKVHQLNVTAGLIWRMCESETSPEATARLLAERFDVDAEVALNDIRKTVAELRALNLLVDV